jgi:hypothetical protein
MTMKRTQAVRRLGMTEKEGEAGVKKGTEVLKNNPSDPFFF